MGLREVRESTARQAITPAMLDQWHLEQHLAALKIYDVRLIRFKDNRPVEIIGDYEDSSIRLIYSSEAPNSLMEIRLGDMPSAAGRVVRTAEELAAVRLAIQERLEQLVMKKRPQSGTSSAEYST